MDSSPVAMQIVLANQAHEIESFLHQLDEKESMISSLSHEVASLRDRQSQLELSNSELQSSSNQLKERTTILQSQADQLEQQLKEAHTQTIPSLSNQVHSLDQQLGSLQEERDRLQQQVDDMNDDIQRMDELKSRVHELEEDNVRLQRDNSSFEYDIAMIRRDNDSLHAKAEQDARELNQLHHTNDSLSVQLNQLSADISQRDRDIQSLTQQISDLQRRDQSASQELLQRDQMINQLQGSVKEQQANLTSYQQQLQRQQQELTVLHKSLDDAMASADNASNRVTQLESQSSKAQTVTNRAVYLLQMVMAALAQSRSSNQPAPSSAEAMAQLSSESPKEFERSVEALQTWTHRLQEENISLQSEVASLQSSAAQLREMKKQYASQERALSDANSRIISLQNSLEQQEKAQQAASLSSHDAVTRLQQQILDLQREAETKYRALGERYNALVENYNHLQEEKSNNAKELDALRGELERRKQELKTTMDNLQALQKMDMEREEAVVRLQNLRKEKELADQRIQDLEVEKTRAQRQLQEVQDANSDDKAKIATLQSQLAALQGDFDALLGERDSMQAHLDTTTQQNANDVNALMNSVKQLQQQLAAANQRYQHEVEVLNGQLQEQKHREQSLQASYDSLANVNANNDRQYQLTARELETAKMKLLESEQQYIELQESYRRVQKEDEAKGTSLRSLSQQLKEMVQEFSQNSRLNMSKFVWRQSLIGQSLAEMSVESPDAIEDSVRELYMRCRTLLSDNRRLRDDIATLENSLAAAEKNQSAASQLTMLRSQLREAQSRVSSQEIALTDLQNQLASKEQSLNVVQQDLSQARDMLSSRDRQISALQAEIDNARASSSRRRNETVVADSLYAAPDVSAIGIEMESPLKSAESVDSLRSQLQALQSELSDKRMQIIKLQSEADVTKQRFQEAMATIQSLEARLQIPQQSPPSSSAEVWTQRLESAQRASSALQEHVDQLTRMYNESSTKLEQATAEVASLRRSVELKEQECLRLNGLLRSSSSDSMQQLTTTLRLKDQEIARLQGEVEQQRLSAQQAQREMDMEIKTKQNELAELRGILAAREQDTIALDEVRMQLSLKQQEVNRLQKQLLTEFGLVETMKMSFNQLDQLLTQRLADKTQPSNLQAALKSVEEHNAYLQRMITSLESQNRELLAQKMTAESKLVQPAQPVSPASTADRQQLQRIVRYLESFFPQMVLYPEGVEGYVKQLGQMLTDQKSLYSSLRIEWNGLQKQNADLAQKVAMLRSYASGHDHIDQKADAFVQNVVKERNEFEQQLKNAKVDLEQKKTELEQVKRSLASEQQVVESLRKEKESAKGSRESRDSTLPPEFTSLIEECMNVCLLAKLDKTKKMTTLQDVVDTLRRVRRGISSTLNLLRRENERLSIENKRIKEMSAQSKRDEDRLNAKIREIIRVVQNQGKALKEFVVAFQSIQKR